MAAVIGQRFGKLVVVGMAPAIGAHTSWLCQCDCGSRKNLIASKVRRGHTKSCGCGKLSGLRPGNPTHGKCGSGAYKSWGAMMERCYRPKSGSYNDYGGKGVAVCERWHTFANFFADMGDRPAGMSIDRIDSMRGYDPGNCRWTTRTAQARNRSNTTLVEYKGQRVKLADLVEQYGQDHHRVKARLRIGWTLERALSEPKLK